MQAGKVYRKDPETITRQIDDQLVVIPLNQDVKIADLGVFHILKNSTAVTIWELIDGKRDISAIARCLAMKFDVAPEEAVRDTASFLRELEKIKAIR